MCTVEMSSTPMTPVKMVDSVWPLYGPVAGGTQVTITGQILRLAIVKAVYFGHHEGVIDRQRSALQLFMFHVMTNVLISMFSSFKRQ